MQQIKAKVYQYTKNLFMIDGVKLNVDVINKHFPNYAIDSSVYAIYYEQGGKSNYIKYADGRTKALSDYEPYYEEQFAKNRIFEFECKEELAKKKAPPIVEYKVTVYDIFNETDVNKRIELKKEYELERQSYVLTNEKMFLFLNDYKKRRLARTDWTQNVDVQDQMTDDQKAEWAAYRQALRELDKVSDPISEAFLPTEPPNPLG